MKLEPIDSRSKWAKSCSVNTVIEKALYEVSQIFLPFEITSLYWINGGAVA